MAIVTRNDEIIATIHFENERLIVRAITQDDADRILAIISVPYSRGYLYVSIVNGEEATVKSSKLTFPGTQEHCRFLGVGAASTWLFSEPEQLLPDWNAQAFTLPSFQFRSEYYLLPNND